MRGSAAPVPLMGTAPPFEKLEANECLQLPRRCSMFGDFEVREIVDDLFEEEALVIGGLVAAYGMNDNLVTSLMGNFSAIRD